MIKKNNREISGIFRNSKAIQIIYRNGKVIWEAIRSCFGSGYWVNFKPWLNDEGWKNN